MRILFNVMLIATLLQSNTVLGQSETYSFENLVYDGVTYDAFMVKITPENLAKFHVWRNSNQVSHTEVIKQNNWKGSSSFAVNLSISDMNCNPLGLFIENSIERQALNLKNGKGNFFLKPNGVLLITDEEALIGESSQVNNFDRKTTPIKFAIQSGPLLLDGGKLNSKIKDGSQSRYRRCGVGITIKSGNAYLVFCLTTNPVNFYELAMLFSKKYACEAALCLESSGCALKLPYLDNAGAEYSGIICNYLVYD